MHTLALDIGDGSLFEQIYLTAMQLTDPVKTGKLSESIPDGATRYWQSAFEEANGSDKALTSAILSTLKMPFGAYTLTLKTEDRLEITPWLYSDKDRIAEIAKRIEGGETDAATLYSVSRTLSLTADFLIWLDKFSNSEKRG